MVERCIVCGKLRHTMGDFNGKVYCYKHWNAAESTLDKWL